MPKNRWNSANFERYQDFGIGDGFSSPLIIDQRRSCFQHQIRYIRSIHSKFPVFCEKSASNCEKMSDFFDYLELNAILRVEMANDNEIIEIFDDENEDENEILPVNRDQSEIIEISEDDDDDAVIDDDGDDGNDGEIIVISDDDDDDNEYSGLAEILAAGHPGWDLEYDTENELGFDYEPPSWNVQNGDDDEDDDNYFYPINDDAAAAGDNNDDDGVGEFSDLGTINNQCRYHHCLTPTKWPF